ncbi:MAG: IS1634 family transposase [Candidatus Azobacteroides sp.]|nr:IS1634 family transposase [Candidatus Azobacteroides sp.]
MYFRSSIRNNPETGQLDSYYRLVESYRNETDRVCHRTLLNVGFLSGSFNADALNQVRRIICKRYQDIKGGNELFEIQTDNPKKVIDLADKLWNELVDKNRIDIGQKPPKPPTQRQRNMVFEESIRHPDVRKIGSEWLCNQALEQLKVADFLTNIGFSEEETQLAITQIIARAVYPASELETACWIRENSAVCQITGYPIEKITKDKLYKSALKLFCEKQQIEDFLTIKTNQLFDIEDKIYIYDLTNTYFESKKRGTLAKFGRSKEKRSDCKLVVLALVINPAGFIKYSSIFEGNMQDSNTLKTIVCNLRKQTSTAKRAIVVIDAGIATEENLTMLTENNFDYVCVSRCKLKDYKIDPDASPVEVEDRKKQKIKIQKVVSEKHNDFFLKIESKAKQAKEVSMNNRFQEGFEKGLSCIYASLSKKSGIKTEEKVYERVGRLKQKYPSITKYYEIGYEIETETVTNRKTKEKTEIRKVKSMTWKVKQNVEPNAESGTYFLRTSLKMSEQLTWMIYNIIREIEYSFRTLKTDLDLRPIYHKTDDATMAHLHLGLLAYWIVNTVRYQLKKTEKEDDKKQKTAEQQPETPPINFQWSEIIRIMNTQKSVLTVSQNRYDEVIISRRCSDPTPKAEAIYRRLNYKSKPFVKRKFVVHKSEYEKMLLEELQRFMI